MIVISIGSAKYKPSHFDYPKGIRDIFCTPSCKNVQFIFIANVIYAFNDRYYYTYIFIVYNVLLECPRIFALASFPIPI